MTDTTAPPPGHIRVRVAVVAISDGYNAVGWSYDNGEVADDDEMKTAALSDFIEPSSYTLSYIEAFVPAPPKVPDTIYARTVDEVETKNG